MTKPYTMDITARDFNPAGAKYPDDAPYTATGQLYDLLAVASGHRELEDLDCYMFEAYDAAIDYVLNGYDYETAYIDALNKATEPETLATLLGLDVYALIDPKSNLLPGAYVALNHPTAFLNSLKAWTESIRDIVYECSGGYAGRDGLPEDFAKELDDAYDATADSEMREYLHGDGRNWAGVYLEAERALFPDFPSINLCQNEKDRRENVLRVTIDADDARQLVADYEGVDLTASRVGQARVKAAIVSTIHNGANIHQIKRKAEVEKNRAERERTNAYKKEQREKEEEERRARLLAMTR